jgi:hypothetical protein
LEKLGVLNRARLVSKANGWRGPNLYRIGGKIESLPSEAANRFMFPPRRAIESGKLEAT